jgi:hypothetical protein
MPRIPRPALVAAILTVLVFLPGLAGDFVFDDRVLIVGNPHAHALRELPRVLTTHLWDIGEPDAPPPAYRYYRPFVSATYLLDWVISGGKPWFFHATNLMAHALAVFLAVRIAARWLGSESLGLVAGLAFALHPSRTENVLWVAGRTDVWMTVFLFLAVELIHQAGKGVRFAPLFTGITAVLALASKESAVFAPLLLAAEVVISPPAGAHRRVAFSTGYAVTVLSVAYVAVRAFFYPVRENAPFQLTLLHGAKTIVNYTERVVFPWPQTFFLRPILQTATGRLDVPAWMIATALCLGIGYLALVVCAWRRDRGAALLLAAAAAWLAPVLNLTYVGKSVQTGNDRCLYLPLFLLVCGLVRLERTRATDWILRRPVRLALGGWTVIAASVIVLRSLDYHSDRTFWQHELDVDPANPFALREIGFAHARDGELAASAGYFARTLEPPSSYYVALNRPEERYTAYINLLYIEGLRTGDGDAPTLEKLLREWLFLLEGQQSDQAGRIGELVLGRHFGARTLKESAVLEKRRLSTLAAPIAVRLGHDDIARRLLIDAEPRKATIPENVVVAFERLGDFDGARRFMARMRQDLDGVQNLGSLEAQLARAEPVLQTTSRSHEPQARVARAVALAELGAYLRALRLLRPFYVPDRPQQLSLLYVRVLLLAGLDQEALHEAELKLGASQARALLQELSAENPPSRALLRKIDEPVAWFTDDPASRSPDARTTPGNAADDANEQHR